MHVMGFLKDDALAAPLRHHSHLSIVPCVAGSGSPSAVTAMKAEVVTSLLSLERFNLSTRKLTSIGIDAQTLAEAVHMHDFSHITSLRLSCPLEARYDSSRMLTDVFIEYLPDSFVYKNIITTLELKTSELHDIIMTLIAPQTRRGATTLPFPCLCLLRATLPRCQAGRSRETSQETGARLREALETRGVAF